MNHNRSILSCNSVKLMPNTGLALVDVTYVKTDPLSCKFSLQRWKHKMLALFHMWFWHCEGDRGPFFKVKLCHHLNNKHSASPCSSYVFYFIFSSKIVGCGGWYQWSNHFPALTQQCQLVTWIQKHPTLFDDPQPPSCLRSPGKLCISALGGKHYTGLAQGSRAY